MTKKLFSFLVAALMVLSLLPMGAIAEAAQKTHPAAHNEPLAKPVEALKAPEAKKAPSYPSRAEQTLYSFGFETDPAEDGWTFCDLDGNGTNWAQSTNKKHNGYYSLMSSSYKPTSHNVNNWAITPAIELPATGMAALKFWIAQHGPSFPETWALYIGEAADPEQMDVLQADTTEGSTTFEQKEYDISEYLGKTVYIAFVNHNCNNKYYIYIDDVEIVADPEGAPATPTPEPTAVPAGYLDDVMNAADTDFVISFTSTGTYPWIVMTDEADRVYAMSGNKGMHSTSSTVTATFTLDGTYLLSFDYMAWGEGTSTAWDKCIFKLDGTVIFTKGAENQPWQNYVVETPLEAGEHTIEFTFTKDGADNGTGDYFKVDNVKLADASNITPTPEPTAIPDGEDTYYLTDTLEVGKEYLIVNSDQIGNASALITVGSAASASSLGVGGVRISEEDGYTLIRSYVTEGFVWTATAGTGNNTLLKSNGNSNYLHCSYSDGLTMYSSIYAYEATYSNFVLKLGSYTVFWNGTAFAATFGGSGNIYLFEKTDGNPPAEPTPTPEPTPIPDGEDTYYLTDTLEVGKEYLIVNSDQVGSASALITVGSAAAASSLGVGGVRVSEEDGNTLIHSFVTDAYVWTATAKSNGSIILKNNGNSNYLDYSGGLSMYGNTGAYPVAYSDYVLSISTAYSTYIVYWNGTAFAASASGSGNIYLYEKMEAPPVPVTPEPEPDFGCYFETEQDVYEWYFVDADGDGHNWEWKFNSSMAIYEGSGIIASASYDNDSYKALTPDNWAISPEVTVLGEGSFAAMYLTGQDPSDFAEHFGLYVGRGTDVSNYELIDEYTIDAARSYKRFTIDLGAYAGETVSIAIRHFDCTNMFWLDLDAVQFYGCEKGGYAFEVIEDIELFGFDFPAWQASPDRELTVPDTAHYSFGSIEWYFHSATTGEDSLLIEADVFDDILPYRALVRVVPDYGYKFALETTAMLEYSDSFVEGCEYDVPLNECTVKLGLFYVFGPFPRDGELVCEKSVTLEADGTYTLVYGAYGTGTYHGAYSVLKVFISDGIVMPESDMVGVYRHACIGFEDGTPVFEEVVTPIGDEPELSVLESERLVEVKGFDYYGSTVHEADGTPGGFKLVVKITGVLPTEPCPVGSIQTDDAETSGVYYDAGTSAVEAVRFPEASIVIGEASFAYDFAAPMNAELEGASSVLSLTDSVRLIETGSTTVSTESGSAAVSGTEIAFEPAGICAGFTAMALVELDEGGYEWQRVSFIPATTVLYEEDRIDFESGDYANGSYAEWQLSGTPGSVVLSGDSVYGYDIGYASGTGDSNSSAMCVTVDKALFDAMKQHPDSAQWPKAHFSFTGTGVDVLSRIGSDTGVVLVSIIPDGIDGQEPVHVIVDTYYPGLYGEVLYQTPIVHVTGLEYGRYTVDITALYMPGFDHQPKSAHTATGNGESMLICGFPGLPDGEYEIARMFNGPREGAREYGAFNLFIDGFRVYDPLGDGAAERAYIDAHEYDPTFKSVKKLVMAQVGSVESAMFFKLDDEEMTVESDEYVNILPANELYVLPSGGVAFMIEGDYDRVQISLRAPAGKTAAVNINGRLFSIAHTAELYYDITELIGSEGMVAVTCVGEGSDADAVLSIVNIKLTAAAPTRSGANGPIIVSAPALFEFALALHFGLKGDADHSGSVDITDALLAMRSALNISELGTYGRLCADMNGDGIIDMTDALMIMRMALC